MSSLNIPGLKVGHATDAAHQTGCTVFLCPEGTVGSVDVRGPAPGSHETALLQPDKPIHHINGLVFTGGSAFGMATVDGVMRYLGERGIGHKTPIRPIPIVSAAVVYDLFFSRENPPTAEMGYAACLAACEDDIPQGNVGAGTGVTVGKWGGFDNVIMKGGFGFAGETIDGVVVSAAAVTNAIGDVVNADGTVLAGSKTSTGTWLVEQNPYRIFRSGPPTQLGTNTTLVVVATNAKLDGVEANRLAQRAHDGMAIAIRPVHTTHDGDIAFSLATGQVEANFDLVANVGVAVVAEAIRNSVRFAETVGQAVGLASGNSNR
ncbi:MAG: P1 family peptidase [Anaerolineales bacterium]|nr:P1 family peptidase [Anaerolineales bacterium]